MSSNNELGTKRLLIILLSVTFGVSILLMDSVWLGVQYFIMVLGGSIFISLLFAITYFTDEIIEYLGGL